MQCGDISGETVKPGGKTKCVLCPVENNIPSQVGCAVLPPISWTWIDIFRNRKNWSPPPWDGFNWYQLVGIKHEMPRPYSHSGAENEKWRDAEAHTLSYSFESAKTDLRKGGPRILDGNDGTRVASLTRWPKGDRSCTETRDTNLREPRRGHKGWHAMQYNCRELWWDWETRHPRLIIEHEQRRHRLLRVVWDDTTELAPTQTPHQVYTREKVPHTNPCQPHIQVITRD